LLIKNETNRLDETEAHKNKRTMTTNKLILQKKIKKRFSYKFVSKLIEFSSIATTTTKRTR